MRPPGVPHWTDEECRFLEEFVSCHGHKWVQAAQELRARFGERRPYASDMLRKKWGQICMKTGAEPVSTPTAPGRRPKLPKWTDVEEEVLVALVDEHGQSWQAVALGMADRLGEFRKYTARNAKSKWESLALENRYPWEASHDKYLSMLMAMYPDNWDKMAEIFAKRFGSAMDVTGAQLRTRAATLSPPKQEEQAGRLPRATASAPFRRRRVEFESSSDEMEIAKPKVPKLPKPTPKRGKVSKATRKSVGVPPSSPELSPTSDETGGERKAAGVDKAESGGARPRSKSCLIQ